MQLDCRLLVDDGAPGPWNMAVDEVLLDAAAEMGTSSLRFYRWREPTLSLGYFQNYAQRNRHSGSRDCPVVRRASGGGAILHDAEITYSLALPLTHPAARSAAGLYAAVHQSLIASLALGNVRAATCCQPIARSPAEQPFLCFQRHSTGDVLVGGIKICGSAQRRRAGAILQHGSLILRASRAAPELPGLCEAAGLDFNPADIVTPWQADLAGRLSLVFTTSRLSALERDRAGRLTLEKYDSAKWTMRR